METVEVVKAETRCNFELLSLQADLGRKDTARGNELKCEGGRVRSRAGMRGIDGRRGGEERWGLVGRSGRVMEGAGFGEGIVRRESREKRIRRGVGGGRAGASDMGGKRKGCDFVDAWRFILAERIDWDSARSRERKERNCCSLQRREYRSIGATAGGVEREDGKEPRRGT